MMLRRKISERGRIYLSFRFLSSDSSECLGLVALSQDVCRNPGVLL